MQNSSTITQITTNFSTTSSNKNKRKSGVEEKENVETRKYVNVKKILFGPQIRLSLFFMFL